ncbi:hypothetical protein ZIOFF_011435 [Zingiber officinale]|uniref:Glutaredoxin domain-containing protein n=1 Tax=Zingiber officinale TaxID=94328 RepID=A0A8J5HJ87_ZINOF|nr:hypothetical protein ZIOFF_011435 [Zingiber officinale]
MKLASQRAVVIFSLSSCYMTYSVKSLFTDLGVNAIVHELDQDPRGAEMEKALVKLLGRRPAVPAVFIGGRFIGSTDRVMSLHLGGNLVPLLREAGEKVSKGDPKRISRFDHVPDFISHIFNTQLVVPTLDPLVVNISANNTW